MLWPSFEDAYQDLAGIRRECRGCHAPTPSWAMRKAPRKPMQQRNKQNKQCSADFRKGPRKHPKVRRLGYPTQSLCLRALLVDFRGLWSLHQLVMSSWHLLAASAYCRPPECCVLDVASISAVQAPLGERDLLSKVMRQRPDST